MIVYYAALAHSLGGRVMAYYLNGCAVQYGGRMYGFQTTHEEARTQAFYLTDSPSAERREGWPLDSLSLDLEEAPQQKHEDEEKKRLKTFLRQALGLESADCHST